MSTIGYEHIIHTHTQPMGYVFGAKTEDLFDTKKRKNEKLNSEEGVSWSLFFIHLNTVISCHDEPKSVNY